MRFSKVRIHEEQTSRVGLKEINLKKKPLGSIVALIGRNGAGKSRILDLIESYLSQITEQRLVEDYLTHIPNSLIDGLVERDAIPIDYHERLAEIKTVKIVDIGVPGRKDLSPLTPFLNRIKQFGQAYIKIVNNDELNNIKDKTDVLFNYFVENTHLDDYFKTKENDDPNKKGNIINRINEFSSFNSLDTVEYFQQIANEIAVLEVELILKNRENIEKVNELLKANPSKQLFDVFQRYIKHFLGQEFTYQTVFENGVVKSNLYQNDKQFDIKLLSPGQRTLFAFAVLLFFLDANKKTNIKDSIIIIDEPEKHLHPEAQISLINALREIVSESGQLWIATHSVHILSHLEYDEIFMVKDGEITPPSKITPGKSLIELMGFDEYIEELSAFINSTSEWAYANFMRQCFTSPEIISYSNNNDPQFKLFKKFLSDFSSSKLLDYGAGKGRIGNTINEDEDLSKRIIYHAYEPNTKIHKELIEIAKTQNIYSITTSIQDNFFDSILLCNVLHEIHPQQWIGEFNEIKRILKPDGYLLIIEDKFLPKGEDANECGYLILGSSQLKILLTSNEILELKLEEKNYKDRILFCAIKKEQININANSLIQALESLKDSSFEQLKKLRQPCHNVSLGRLYANQSQLFINSLIAIELLKNPATQKQV